MALEQSYNKDSKTEGMCLWGTILASVQRKGTAMEMVHIPDLYWFGSDRLEFITINNKKNVVYSQLPLYYSVVNSA